jgi:acetyl-CoA acyltransferase
VTEAYVYDAVRTPFGRLGGALAQSRPDDLAAFAVRTLLDRSPGLDPAAVAEGDAGQRERRRRGEPQRRPDGRAAGRAADVVPGLDGEPALRLQPGRRDGRVAADRDRGCRRRRHRRGRVDDQGAWVLPKPDKPYPTGNVTAVSTALGWRLVNPRMSPEWTVSLGEACEQLGEKHGISRERQDAFALRSHQLADRPGPTASTRTWCPGAGHRLERDEGIRPGSTPEKLASLRPSFRPNGTITAGNASPLNDGASAVLLGSAGAAATIGRTRWPASPAAGRWRWSRRTSATRRWRRPTGRWSRAGIGWSDVGRGRAQRGVRGAVAGLPGRLADRPGDRQHPRRRDRDRAPARASGGRILGTLAAVMRADGHRWGVAAICIGVGQGLAVVLENAG